MKCFLLSAGLLVGALSAGVAVHAQPDAQPQNSPAGTAQPTVERVPDAVAHRATAIPDRIVLTWVGDPARSQAVTWRTDSSVSRGLAQIALASAYPRFGETARTLAAVTTPLSTNLGTAHYHSVNFSALTPNTQYAYRVGDGANWSEWIHFRTAGSGAQPFSFIYFGDAQNEVKSLWSRALRAAYSDAPKARFMIHAGDLINNANNDAEWGEWFGAGGWVNAMLPSISTPGNHEYNDYDKPGSPVRLSRHWRPQFALPENGPPGLQETVYFIDYQGVRIISLNTEEKHEEQVAWLDRVLASNPHRWTILTLHRPMFSSAKGRDNETLRKLWMPLFDKHHVDLVLQGHDHTYARSKNLRSGITVRNDQSGTVYVVSVSGPKMYNLEREPWMQRAAEDTQLYQIITVNGNTLHYEARTVTGEIYDAFDLAKQSNRINRLIERTPPGLPERLRPPAATAPVAAAPAKSGGK